MATSARKSRDSITTADRVSFWVRQIRNSAILAAVTSLLSALATFAQARSLSIDYSASATSTDLPTLAGLFVSGLYSVASLWFTVGLMGFGLRGAQLVRDRGQKLRLKPGWAIGGWFIPIGQLIIPFIVLTDITAGVPDEAKAGSLRRSAGWFWIWWTALSQLASYGMSMVLSADAVVQFNGWKLYAGALAFNIVPLMLARRFFAQLETELVGNQS